MPAQRVRLRALVADLRGDVARQRAGELPPPVAPECHPWADDEDEWRRRWPHLRRLSPAALLWAREVWACLERLPEGASPPGLREWLAAELVADEEARHDRTTSPGPGGGDAECEGVPGAEERGDAPPALPGDPGGTPGRDAG